MSSEKASKRIFTSIAKVDSQLPVIYCPVPPYVYGLHRRLMAESGPIGPSRAPADINAHVCVCVCVSTGFVPGMIKLVRSWRGHLADRQVWLSKALAWRFGGRLPGAMQRHGAE